MQVNDFLQKFCFGAANIFDRLARHRIGKKSDEVARVAGPQRDANFTVGFEAADSGPVASTWIDDHKRSSTRIDFDTLRRNNSDKCVIYRAIKLAAVDNEFKVVIKHIRRCLREMLAILVATLAHDIPKQDAALRRIDEIFKGRAEHVERLGTGFRRV